MSQSEHKQHFQLERIILFSDAVFAIAITLLILDIKLPDKEQLITKELFDNNLEGIVPRLIGFLVSFFLIGFYWTIHHRIFTHVIRYDRTVLRLNLLLLLFIVLLPFSTSLVAEYNYLTRPYSIYYINLGLIGLSLFFLQLYLTTPVHLLCSSYESPRHRRFDCAHLLSIPVIFFIGAGFAASDLPILLFISRFIYLLIGPVKFVLKKIYFGKIHSLSVEANE